MLLWAAGVITRFPLVGIAAMAGSLTACADFSPPERLPAPVAELPAGYAEGESLGAAQPLNWWHDFNDPTLNRLVDEALLANLDIAEAAARVEEARAQARIAGADRFPSVNASAGANYSDTPLAGTNFGGFGGGATRLTNETYSTGLDFAYELDFWGRVRNDARAARADLVAAEADLRTARLGALAETISTYFEVVDLRAQIALAVATIDILQDRVENTERRYDRGLVSSFELYQLRQDYRNTQAALPQRESQLTDAEGRLAVLLGRYAGTLRAELGDRLAPQLVFDPIPTGLPADLLIQRPDVAAAAQRFEAARFRVGARRAELFPSLSLSSTLGTQSDSPSGVFDILDNWVLNLGASLTAPLFQGGRIRANIDVAEARYAQQTASYARTVLTAYREVTAALEDYEEQRQRYALLFAQLQEAEASANLQAERYAAGVSAFTDYLDALRNLYQVRSSLSGAGRDVALARLAVHRGLGGGWTETAATPDIPLVDRPTDGETDGS
ncbi:TolC family protein [Parasphingopyxis algicola]|uniref:efflux transporter outer membrane subunit n=1 Tax=Parasphingopyxis algicola TaxID=2026624 RepID=UPI0015A0143C|nr:TolC family protein [Parasphingopyxis algicola]QLC25388.1 TolC family protein [Parasphingopyxis algicola]